MPTTSERAADVDQTGVVELVSTVASSCERRSGLLRSFFHERKV
jgi:hypothetical protein